MAENHPRDRERLGLGILILAHIIICCASLIYLANDDHPIAFYPAPFHLFYDPASLHMAVSVVAAFALVSYLFTLARFSLGYFVGFYFYTMVLGFLWLNCFTDLKYDHQLAGLSAAASAVAFLLPALFISSPVRQAHMLSAAAFDRLLTVFLMLGIVAIGVGATYNFRFVAIPDIYDFRNKMELPELLNYAIGMTSGALLPFAFAGFMVRETYWKAGAVLLLLLFLYPVTLSKLALFTPVWLAAILFLSKLFEARVAVILSLAAPVLLGLVLVYLFDGKASLYISVVNHRMVAIPSLAMTVYNDFFSTHDLTHFCQISFLKYLVSCPYREPLSVVMERTYNIGHFNASLFATEGIASVGVLFAPIAVLVL